MAVIASAVFAVIFLITPRAALDNGCTCTPNTNDTTTLTLSTPGLPSCERQWLDENDTVLTYNNETGPGVLSLTLGSIITKGCQKQLNYSEHCPRSGSVPHVQDLLREVVCLCDCHGHSKTTAQSVEEGGNKTNGQSGEEGGNKTNGQSGEEGGNKTNGQSDLGRDRWLVVPCLFFPFILLGCITVTWKLNCRKNPGQEKTYEHV